MEARLAEFEAEKKALQADRKRLGEEKCEREQKRRKLEQEQAEAERRKAKQEQAEAERKREEQNARAERKRNAEEAEAHRKRKDEECGREWLAAQRRKKADEEAQKVIREDEAEVAARDLLQRHKSLVNEAIGRHSSFLGSLDALVDKVTTTLEAIMYARNVWPRRPRREFYEALRFGVQMTIVANYYRRKTDMQLTRRTGC